jgi:hypothetical protein
MALDLKGPADGLELNVFTKALVVVGRLERAGFFGAGWDAVPLGQSLVDLPKGLYYVQVRAVRGGIASAPVFVKVYVTR